MAAADLDALLEKLRRLPPKQLERVKHLVDELAPGTSDTGGRFAALVGTVGRDEAEAMARAIEDCERIDLSAW